MALIFYYALYIENILLSLQQFMFALFLGPRLFLSCPMDVTAMRSWFNDLWNYSLVPYMLEAVREGLQVKYSLYVINRMKFVLSAYLLHVY